MTVSSTVRRAGYIGNDTAVTFPFYFKVFTSADVAVVQADASGNESTLALTADYTVSLNADQDSTPGGSVTLVAGSLASGYTLTIYSTVASTQGTSIANASGFYPKVITDALDKSAILTQQLEEKHARSLQFPVSDNVSAVLPPALQRAGCVLGFGPDGSIVPVSISFTPTGVLATVPFSATPTFDLSVGSVLEITLTGNVTSSTAANAAGRVGQVVTFVIVQDNVGGHSFTWPTNVKSGDAIDQTAGAINIQSFVPRANGNLYPIGPLTVN